MDKYINKHQHSNTSVCDKENDFSIENAVTLFAQLSDEVQEKILEMLRAMVAENCRRQSSIANNP